MKQKGMVGIEEGTGNLYKKELIDAEIGTVFEMRGEKFRVTEVDYIGGRGLVARFEALGGGIRKDENKRGYL